jgi:hypothetical protein
VLVLLILIFTFFLPACRASTSLSVGLSVDDAVLAAKTDDQWQVVEDNVFQRGDIIGLVMLNVSGFKKGEDGLNWMDLDLVVKGPDGAVILDEKELLGEAGHIDMPDNTAKSPVGSFYTTDELEPGDYVIKVTLYDKVGKGSTTHTKKIILE